MTVLRSAWNAALANDGKVDRNERKAILAKVKAAGEVCGTEIQDIFEETDRAMDAANATGDRKAINTAAETRGNALILVDQLRDTCDPPTWWERVLRVLAPDVFR